MSIGEIRPSKLEEASRLISDQVSEFLNRGGQIKTCATEESNAQAKTTRVWWRGNNDANTNSYDSIQSVDGVDPIENSSYEDDGNVFIA